MTFTLIEGSACSGKTTQLLHRLCEALQAFPSEQVLVLASSPARQTALQLTVLNTLNQPLGYVPIYTFGGWVRNTLFEQWPWVEQRLASAKPAVSPTEETLTAHEIVNSEAVLQPFLCGLDTTEFFLSLLLEELAVQHPQWLSVLPTHRKSLLNQVLRRFRLRSENGLDRKTLQQRSVWLGLEAETPVLSWIEAACDRMAYRCRTLDATKQLEVFMGLLQNNPAMATGQRAHTQALLVDDVDEASPALQQFITWALPHVKHLTLAANPNGGSRMGALGAYPQGWKPLKQAVQAQQPSVTLLVTNPVGGTPVHEESERASTPFSATLNWLQTHWLEGFDELIEERTEASAEATAEATAEAIEGNKSTPIKPEPIVLQPMVQTWVESVDSLFVALDKHLNDGGTPGELSWVLPTADRMNLTPLLMGLQQRNIAVEVLSGTQRPSEDPWARTLLYTLLVLNPPNGGGKQANGRAGLRFLSALEWRLLLSQVAFSLGNNASGTVKQRLLIASLSWKELDPLAQALALHGVSIGNGLSSALPPLETLLPQLFPVSVPPSPVAVTLPAAAQGQLAFDEAKKESREENAREDDRSAPPKEATQANTAKEGLQAFYTQLNAGFTAMAALNYGQNQSTGLQAQAEWVLVHWLRPAWLNPESLSHKAVNQLLEGLRLQTHVVQRLGLPARPALARWLRQALLGVVANTSATPQTLNPQALVISTPQKLIDAGVQRPEQWWLHTGHGDWCRQSDVAPLYHAAVFSPDFKLEKEETTGNTPEAVLPALNQKRLEEQMARKLLKMLPLATRKVRLFRSQLDVEGNTLGFPLLRFLPETTQLATASIGAEGFINLPSPREDQAPALEYREGSMAITAVPGAGKTFINIHLIKTLLEAGHAAPSLLVLTFMESAAKTLQARLQKLLGSEAAQPSITTIHGLAYRLLNEGDNAQRAGLPEGWKLADEPTLDQLLRQAAFASLPLASRTEPGLSVEDWMNALRRGLGQAKNLMLSYPQLQAYAEANPKQTGPLAQALLHGWGVLQQLLNAELMLDFTDLIQAAIRLLQQHPEMRSKAQAQFSVILEDEAQDSSPLLQTLLQLLARDPANFIRTGDLNQCITTTFSAAHPEGFRQFMEQAGKTVTMNYSGRCTPAVLHWANRWLEKAGKAEPVLSKAFYPIAMQPVAGFNPEPLSAADTWEEEEGFVEAEAYVRKQGQPLTSNTALKTNEVVAKGSPFERLPEKLPEKLIVPTPAQRKAEQEAKAAETALQASGCCKSLTFETQKAEEAWLVRSVVATAKAYPQASLAVLVRTNRQVLYLTQALQQAGLHAIAYQEGLHQSLVFEVLLAYLEALAYPMEASVRVRLLDLLVKAECKGFTGLGLSTLEEAKTIVATSAFFFEPVSQVAHLDCLLQLYYDWLEFSQDALGTQLEALLLKLTERLFSSVLERSNGALCALFAQQTLNQAGQPKAGAGGVLGQVPQSPLEVVLDAFKALKRSRRGLRGFTASDLTPTERLTEAGEEKPLNVGGYVHVLTLHKAKGQEFDAVWLPGLTERDFPYLPKHVRPRLDDRLVLWVNRTAKLLEPALHASLPSTQEELVQSQLEEEARLLYVGITRARRQLRLSTHQFKQTKAGKPYPVGASLMMQLLR